MIKAFKTTKYLSLLFIAIFWGCKEIPPFIDFTEKVIGLKDTTYVSGIVPAPENKVIYIEDLTGVRCPNCPTAVNIIKDVIAANPARAISLGVYPNALAQFTTPWPGFEVLASDIANEIFTQIYGSPGALPTGGVNRKVFNGEGSSTIQYTKWSGYADVIKTEESPIKLKGEIIKNDSVAKKIKIKVNLIFAKKYDEEVNLTVYLIENKIISKQSMPSGPPKDDFEHNHVLRKAVTSFNGQPLKINASTIGKYEAGRVFEKEFEVEVDSKWKYKNLAFVILANRYDANSKEVLQAAELDLH
ncbi:MAG: Omp28-related outer membrane protein [Bacteroidia bacterium]